MAGTNLGAVTTHPPHPPLTETLALHEALPLWERDNEMAQLQEAVAAYHAALQERTRDRVPLDCGGTHLTPVTAGSREGGAASALGLIGLRK